jgi:hypothetical protein
VQDIHGGSTSAKVPQQASYLQGKGGVIVIPGPGLKQIPENEQAGTVALPGKKPCQGPRCRGPGVVKVEIGDKAAAGHGMARRVG